MSGDDERPRRSWREIDRMRDGGRRGDDEQRPRSPRGEERARAATQQYVRKLDQLFSGSKGGEEAERLAKAVRDAHGTPSVADACRAYCDALGLPSDPSLLSIFLDAGDPALVCATLDAIGAQLSSGSLELTAGIRTQLRMLSDDANDDVADAAEAVLERLSS